MLTGYIEQEILEGRFWYFWLHCRPNDSGPMDLQNCEDDDEDDQDRSDINRSDAAAARS
jgi:hypothetical protein